MGRKLVITVLLVILIVSGSKLFLTWNTYHQAKEEYQAIEQVAYENNKETSTSEIDFTALQKINPDIVGWISIPDTHINYPIVQTSNNETYLHQSFQGKKILLEQFL